jgi:hypothetical protein
MKKWLDKKLKAYQEKATEALEQTQNLPPEQLQAAQMNVLQGAQGHYDPAMAAAIGNPETARFLSLPREEQTRQQQELQARGQRLQRLMAAGTDVELTIESLEPTGTVLCGQREHTIAVLVHGTGEPYRASVVQVLAPPMVAYYAVGARFRGKVDPGDPAEVGLLDRIG